MTDAIDDAFPIRHDIGVPKSNDLIAVPRHLFRPQIILQHRRILVMLSAIKLDHQLAAMTSEVGDEPRNRNLSAKVLALASHHA
jgi:hypothetical protein